MAPLFPRNLGNLRNLRNLRNSFYTPCQNKLPFITLEQDEMMANIIKSIFKRSFPFTLLPYLTLYLC